MEITVYDYKMVINGEQVGASDGQTINVINPANGQLVGTAPKGSVADVEKAVAAACRKPIPSPQNWTAAERLQEAAETSAEGIVTACPGCETLFASAAKADGDAIKVYDIVEVLAESVL